jgi:two-component system OmpR family sensor kinase
MFPHSIRWRLNLWLGFLLLCVLAGFGMTVYQLERINQLNQLDDELERRIAAVSADLRMGPGGPMDGRRGPPVFDENSRPHLPRRDRPDSSSSDDFIPPPRGGFGEPRGGPRELRAGPRQVRLSGATSMLFDETHTDAFYFAVWSIDGSLLRASTNAPANVPMPAARPRDTSTHRRTQGEWREAFHFTERGDCVLAGHSLREDWKAQNHFAGLLLAAGAGVLALGLGVGSWVTTRAIRPIEEISTAASRISAGNLSERIQIDNAQNELGKLGTVLNSTFARLESAFARQKQFTADASHELRTPLTVIISEAQTTLARERSAAEYRESVEACLDTAQQMRRLSESLLELTRSEDGAEMLPRNAVDLAAVITATIDQLRPLAAQRDVSIHCDLSPAKVLGRDERFGQVVTNLLANAIHYNKPGGEIRVKTAVKDRTAVLTVSDSGIGISAEDLPHVFERFYRADKSRTAAAGRTGLGLAICKAIVEVDGGSISVSSELGVGSTFVVRFPLA